MGSAAVAGGAAIVVAEVEGPTVELPESPPAAEHHHHLAPPPVELEGARPADASAGGSPRPLSAEAGAAVAVAARPEAGTTAPPPAKHADEDDFENPYDPSPMQRATPKPKPDGGNARAGDASAALGF